MYRRYFRKFFDRFFLATLYGVAALIPVLVLAVGMAGISFWWLLFILPPLIIYGLVVKAWIYH
jgi:hypothetical protein